MAIVFSHSGAGDHLHTISGTPSVSQETRKKGETPDRPRHHQTNPEQSLGCGTHCVNKGQVDAAVVPAPATMDVSTASICVMAADAKPGVWDPSMFNSWINMPTPTSCTTRTHTQAAMSWRKGTQVPQPFNPSTHKKEQDEQQVSLTYASRRTVEHTNPLPCLTAQRIRVPR